MTQDQIIEWAKESRLQVKSERGWIETNYLERLTRFAHLVAQHQKEQDALICEHLGWGNNKEVRPLAGTTCAAAIRNQNEA